MKRLIVLLAVLLAAGCSSDKLDGTVVRKDVREGYTYVQTIPQYTTVCTTSNKVTSCTQRLIGFFPYTFTVPTCYRLYVSDNDGKKDDGCVDRDRWEKAQKGKHYTGKDLGDRKTKERN